MARWKHGSRFRLGMSRLATCYLPFGQCSRGARRHPSPPGAARTLAAHLRSRAKIAAKTFRATATSAIWKVTYF